MQILVIGGTSFIGPYVVRQIVQLGHGVTVFHRGKTEADLPEGVTHYHSEAAGIPVRQFPEDLPRRNFDVVIHMNAMGLEDAQAAVQAFRGRTGRIVWLSSGDVYRAYGRFSGHEPGPIEPGPLTEDSPLRTVFFPYRDKAKSPGDLYYYYDKILVEQTALEAQAPPAVILRLPKVYGKKSNADLATVYTYRNYPDWRWTHGYVENVAAAIVLAATVPTTPSRIYNVGEEPTPTISERLAGLPSSQIPVNTSGQFNFAQNIVYDTSRIRRELAYAEPISYGEGIRRTLEPAFASLPDVSQAF
jgi:nucleoside-diphosphate-sugar epimerase